MSNQLNIDSFICFAVYTASHAFNRVYKPLLDELGLTHPQYLAMVSLWEEDGQTVGVPRRKALLGIEPSLTLSSNACKRQATSAANAVSSTSASSCFA